MSSEIKNSKKLFTPEFSFPAGALFATGSAIIILRMLLEDLIEPPYLLSNGLTFYENFVDLSHVFLCWWLLFLSVILVAALILKRRFINIFSISLFGLPVLFIVPVVDFLMPSTGLTGIQYQNSFSTFPHVLANLFNPFVSLPGITPGIRIELTIILIGIPFVVRYLLKKSWKRGISVATAAFLLILFFGYLPALYRFAGIPEFQDTAVPDSFDFMRMLLIPLLLLTSGLILRLVHEQPGGWKLLRKAIYPSRMTAYGSAFLAGYFLVRLTGSGNPPLQLSPAMEIIRVAEALSGIWFLFLSTKFRNDIVDLPADRISTPDRPLVTGEISVDTASHLAIIFSAISFPLLIQGSPNELLFWMGFFSISHLYVSRHLNIRKVYPLGQAAIAMLIVLLVLAGAELAVKGGTLEAISFHPAFIPGVFLMAFLVANLKDFRDLEGDRIAGYRSLPMLFSNPLRAVPWLIISTAVIVTLLSFSVGIPMVPVGIVMALYLFLGFRTLRKISGFQEMDKITLLTIWAILACLALFVVNNLFSF
ncbi:MAG: UbiA family prenyltransferase [Acidobacteria bacterium]|nr:UbiA family prenyltransferase [Acidobacteriota bacterium]